MGVIIGIAATASIACWVRPAGGAQEVFCNAPQGYEIVATGPGQLPRVVASGDGPVHTVIGLELRENETTLAIRVR